MSQDRLYTIQQELDLEIKMLKSEQNALRLEHKNICDEYKTLRNVQGELQNQQENTKECMKMENHTLKTHIDVLYDRISGVADTVALLQHRVYDDYEEACVIVTCPTSKNTPSNDK